MNTTISTPWGSSQSIRTIAPGIRFVSTASHGGYCLEDWRLKEMPAILRCANSYSGACSEWFEEDVEWALVCLSFPELFDARECFYAVKTIAAYGGTENAGKYMFSAAWWLASKAGDQVRAKAARFTPETIAA